MSGQRSAAEGGAASAGRARTCPRASPRLHELRCAAHGALLARAQDRSMDGARPRGGARARQSSRAAEARGQGRPRTTNMQGEARTPAAAASAAAGAASSIPRSSGVSRLGVAVPAPGAAAACAASSPITLPPWRGAPTWLGMRTRSKLV